MQSCRVQAISRFERDRVWGLGSELAMKAGIEEKGLQSSGLKGSGLRCAGCRVEGLMG